MRTPGRPMLTDDQRYRVLQARDQRFDGLFVVGVRSTGIYCRPSCPTPIQPLRRNVDFFATTAGAQRAGLRACKRCRPDAVPGTPEWNLRDDLVGRAMQLIGRGWLDSHTVAELAAEVGSSERHLRRVMVEALGSPPLGLARAQRAQTARILVETTDLSFTEISFAAGFASQRQFNDTIRKVFDATPTMLRAQRSVSTSKHGPGSKPATKSAATPAAGSSSGQTRPRFQIAIRLPLRQPFAYEHLASWWDRRTVPRVSTLDGVGTSQGATLRTALRMDNGAGTAALTFTADPWVHCVLALDVISDLCGAVAQCRAMLDLDADPVAIDATLASVPSVKPLVAALPGIRSPGCSDGFATVVFAVLGQQRSVAAARTLAGRIVERANPAATSNRALAPFPSPEALAAANLEGLGLTQRGINTLGEVSARFVGRADELAPGGDRNELCQELLSIKGIGPWTVNYIAMRVFGHPDVFLAGDLVAERAMGSLGLTAADLEKVGPWRSYLTHHLWAASSVLKGNQ